MEVDAVVEAVENLNIKEKVQRTCQLMLDFTDRYTYISPLPQCAYSVNSPPPNFTYLHLPSVWNYADLKNRL